MNISIPIVFEKTIRGEFSLDIYSKLLKERIIFIIGEINDEKSNLIISQLLYLESENKEKDIFIYINSNGGSISSGMAIFDTINYIKPNVITVCMGLAASMAAFLLSAGKKGKRYSLFNSRIMIHQPLSGYNGQASDIMIQAIEVNKLKDILNYLLSVNSRRSFKKISKDTDRDYYMSAYEALNYGLIDHILYKK